MPPGTLSHLCLLPPAGGHGLLPIFPLLLSTQWQSSLGSRVIYFLRLHGASAPFLNTPKSVSGVAPSYTKMPIPRHVPTLLSNPWSDTPDEWTRFGADLIKTETVFFSKVGLNQHPHKLNTREMTSIKKRSLVRKDPANTVLCKLS